jgi:hypothetical protein
MDYRFTLVENAAAAAPKIPPSTGWRGAVRRSERHTAAAGGNATLMTVG